MYTTRGSRRQAGGAGWTRDAGKGKEKEGGSAGNLAIRQAATTTLRSAHSRASRCIASLGRPNVSDDVADIANCKNYHHGTSPAVSSAPYFLTRANPCASRPVLNSMLSRVILTFLLTRNRDASNVARQCTEFRENFSNIHSRRPFKRVFN